MYTEDILKNFEGITHVLDASNNFEIVEGFTNSERPHIPTHARTHPHTHSTTAVL